MLSDIFPTGWHGVQLSKLQPGETAVVYGAGPVGLLAAHSAFLKGASRVFVVDHHTDRLKLAEQIGAEAINRCEEDAVEKVIDLTDGGADRGVEAVGYQATQPGRHRSDRGRSSKPPPGFLVSHELKLTNAAQGYQHFDKREDGWTKVLLHP